jgi:putative membrane protein
VPAAELVRLGLLSNRSLYVAAVAWGLVMQSDLLDVQHLVEAIRGGARLAMQLGGFTGGVPLWLSVTAGLLGLVVVLVVLRLLTVIWMLLRFFGFTLDATAQDLRITYGLTTRHQATIPRRRIQRLVVRQTLLGRLFRRVAIRVETAGGKAEERARSGQGTIAPVLPESRVTAFLGQVQPELGYPPPAWERLAPRALRRMAFRGLIVAALLAGAAGGLWGRWMLLLFVPFAAFVLLRARGAVRSCGFHLGPRALLLRRGWPGWRVTGVPYAKLQSVQLLESPFDRRHGHARLRLDTAGAAAPVQIPYVEARRAREVLEQLEERAAASTFRW